MNMSQVLNLLNIAVEISVDDQVLRRCHRYRGYRDDERNRAQNFHVGYWMVLQ
jgi:hypothetical protein